MPSMLISAIDVVDVEEVGEEGAVLKMERLMDVVVLGKGLTGSSSTMMSWTE